MLSKVDDATVGAQRNASSPKSLTLRGSLHAGVVSRRLETKKIVKFWGFLSRGLI
jgi:hypothetical protein